MTKRLCTFSGCKAVVDHPDDGTSPRCVLHKRPSHNPTTSSHNPPTHSRKHYEHQYDHLGRNIYNTSQWKKVRKARLLLNPLCQHHERDGLVCAAQHVDHIIEIIDGGNPYDLKNTQSLCQSCHNVKTASEKRKRSKGKHGYHSLSNFT